MLPNFMCVGASKSGTTTLYEILKQHSEIGVSSFKEPRFFDNDKNWCMGVEWYQKGYFSNTAEKKMRGEFTSSYLSTKKCPKRIKEICGEDMKFIVMLRNPIDRAYSHYLHTKRDELEKLSFIKALEQEKERLKIAKINCDPVAFAKFSYVFQGLYATHLNEYFQYFNTHQFLIIIFEEFVKNPTQSMRDVFSFLGVSSDEKIDVNLHKNPAGKARSRFLKKAMKKKTIFKSLAKSFITSFAVRQKIRNFLHAVNNKVVTKKPLTKAEREKAYTVYFNKEINRLEDLLDINLNIWKEC